MRYNIIGSKEQFDLLGHDSKPYLGYLSKWVYTLQTKKSAETMLNTFNCSLAFEAGKKGEWITPTFFIKKAS